MTELNWTAFGNLPGAPTANWELLCRELVRRNYAQFGNFRSLNQQPGIEFNLDLSTNCSLGDSSGHWGWQCRWYDLLAGKQIGTRRRKNTEKAIKTTEKYFPDLTDWVLWTRRPLTPTDQEWFYKISSVFKLHLWAEEEVIGCLVGEAAILRDTYFGELILTHEKFIRMHEEAMAPIKKRWEPLLHVEVDAEREIKATLGTPGTWPNLQVSSERLANRVITLNSVLANLKQEEQEFVKKVSTVLGKQSDHLDALAKTINDASLKNVRLSLDNPVTPDFNKRELALLVNKLQSANHPASLSITMALWEINNYFSQLNQLTESLNHNFIAVVSDAGFGKTFLAAELTKVSSSSPGGVLLLAKNLEKNGTLDDLAKRVPFGGERMEELLEAVDAAGARFDRKIPIVIDGLNESENPDDWKDLLKTLQVQLKRTSNCVIIVTVRPAVAKDVLPSDTTRYYLDGFERNSEEAIRTYFKYFKIAAAPPFRL